LGRVLQPAAAAEYSFQELESHTCAYMCCSNVEPITLTYSPTAATLAAADPVQSLLLTAKVDMEQLG